MQISSRTRSIALGTAAGVSLALSGTALAVALGGDDDHGGDRGGRAEFAAQQAPGAQQGDGDRQGYGAGPGAQQGSGDQQSAPSGPPMQSGTS